MSQDDLAEKVGKDRADISRWEHGKAAPKANHVKRLAEILRIQPEDLLVADARPRTLSELAIQRIDELYRGAPPDLQAAILSAVEDVVARRQAAALEQATPPGPPSKSGPSKK